MTKAQEKAAAILENRWTAYRGKVTRLIGHVAARGRVDFKAMRAAFDAGITADAHATAVVILEPVGAAVHASKVEAIASARQHAEKVIERVRADLETHGWDIRAACPVPNNVWAHDYKSKNARRSLYNSLTRTVDYYKAPGIVAMEAELVTRFIANAETDAALQYDMFICKMVAKIGECETAELSGSHVWGYSFLTVTKAGGVREVWKTQQITNYSVYGLPYLQWPSRLLKGGAA